MRTLLWSIAVGLTCAGTAASAAPNDFQVQAVDGVPNVKAGDQIDRSTRVKIPGNGRMTLIDRTGASPRTRECAGPHDGKIEDCPQPSSRTTRTLPSGGTRGIGPGPKSSEPPSR